MRMPLHRGFRGRAFISILVSACFVLLVFSGAILFLAPPGRVANWTRWQVLSLQELARQAGVPLETALQRLVTQGVQGVSAEIDVRTLAEQNQLAPIQIYNLVRGGAGPGGGGDGCKRPSRVSEEKGLRVNDALSRLEARGIHVVPNVTLSDLVEKHGYGRPQEVLDVIRSE